VRETRVAERPDGCTLPGAELTLAGDVGAPRERFIGWIYTAPDGSKHHVVNCGVA